MSNTPLISIITVVYNDVLGIEKTLLSVIEQTALNFEFIVIDGKSVDGTLDVVKKYLDSIDILISEPDKGLYDAMNKGLSVASGKWIFFLNSRDFLLGCRTLLEVQPYLNEKYDVVHFNCKVSNDDGDPINVRRFPKNILEIKQWPCIQHQSVFTKKIAIQQLSGFNLDYKILSDYELFLKLYLKGFSFIFHRNIFISNYNSQGISAQKDSIDTIINEFKLIQMCHLKKISTSLLAQLYFKKYLYLLPGSYLLVNIIRKTILRKR